MGRQCPQHKGGRIGRRDEKGRNKEHGNHRHDGAHWKLLQDSEQGDFDAILVNGFFDGDVLKHFKRNGGATKDGKPKDTKECRDE